MFLNMYIKEMKDMLRDRRTLILSIILPLVLFAGLTLFYDNMMSDGNDKNFTLAVTPESEADVISILQHNKNIEVQSFENPTAAAEKGEALAVLDIQPNFLASLESGEQITMTIAGDSMSLDSSTLMNQVTAAFAVLENQIVTNRLQEQNIDEQLIQPFNVEVKEIIQVDEGATSIGLLSFFLPMLITLSLGIGASTIAVDLFAGEKERKTLEALLMTPVSRVQVLVSKWLTISTLGGITGVSAIISNVLVTLFLTENLKKALPLNDQLWTFLIVSIAITIFFSLFMGALFCIPSILSKTIKEAQSYNSPISMLTVFPSMFMVNLGVNELSTTHFLIPFINIYALFKELLYGVVDFQHVMLAAASLIISIIVCFIVARTMFLKDKWVMN